MTEPTWVRDDVVVAIHRRQIAEHGGAAGIRDRGLLASALAKPRNLLAYSEGPPDLEALAAGYAYGIARNHPFVDGNKRTAFAVCRVFLLLNGADLRAPKEEKYRVFMALAAGEVSEAELAEWIGHSTERIDGA